MIRLITIILLLLIFACSTNNSTDKVLVPESYLVHVQWGFTEKKNNFFYYTGKEVSSLYFTDFKDSVSEIKDFEIMRSTADSIYLLAYHNSRQFDLADTTLFEQIDGPSLTITVRHGNKTVKNIYSGLADFKVNADIEQITKIIKRVTKNQKLFN